MAKEKEEKAVDPRQEAWDAFLVKARAVNPARFDVQKDAGEFDVIPADFVA